MSDEASSDDEEHEERRRALARFFPAGHGLKRSEDLTLLLVDHLTEWALKQPAAEPWVGTTESIYDPALQQECERTNVAARILSVLESIHLSVSANIGREAVAQGTPFEQSLWQCAARPPFPLDVPRPAMRRATLHDLAVGMMDDVVCASKGLLHLPGLSAQRQKHLVLLMAERKADATVAAIPLRAGLALFLIYDPEGTERVTPLGDFSAAAPPPGVVPWTSLSEEHRKVAAFWYAGFTLVDKRLVSAAAGAPDIT